MPTHLTVNQIRTLHQLEDTAYLAVGSLDPTVCQRLVTLGAAEENAAGWWRITEEGRRMLADAKDPKPPGA